MGQKYFGITTVIEFLKSPKIYHKLSNSLCHVLFVLLSLFLLEIPTGDTHQKTTVKIALLCCVLGKTYFYLKGLKAINSRHLLTSGKGQMSQKRKWDTYDVWAGWSKSFGEREVLYFLGRSLSANNYRQLDTFLRKNTNPRKFQRIFI